MHVNVTKHPTAEWTAQQLTEAFPGDATVPRYLHRECMDHVVPMNESHLRKILGEYVAYYNESRCHQSLDGNAPERRDVEGDGGSMHAIPHLGGLHHRYARAG